MTSFAPGTNREYANAYSNWWSGGGKGQAPQRSAFGPDSPRAQPNAAQPVQPQSQGTPYGKQPSVPAPRAQDFSAYRPQPSQPATSNPFAQYNPQQMGNFVQQMSGLPSFQFSATDSFGNTYDNPAALTAQQGAMAQALNAQRAQQVQSGNFGRLNPMAAYQQAQNMVQGGWTNPFAQPNNQQMGTMGGPASDPRWSHNGGQWQSGQAPPVQPPSQGTQYGQPSGGRNAWFGAGRPGYDPNGAAMMVVGASKIDGTRFSTATEAAAYDRWLQSQGDPGAAQPVQPPSPGTRYGTPPDQRGMAATHQFIDGDGDGVDDRYQDGPGMPRYGAPPRRGGFERDAVGMPILRPHNDPSNPTRQMPQPWITTNAGGQVISLPSHGQYVAPRPSPPRRYEPGFAYTRR